MIFYCRGKLKEAVECLDKAIALANPSRNKLIGLFSQRVTIQATLDARVRFRQLYI